MKNNELVNYLKKYEYSSAVNSFSILIAWLPNRSSEICLLYGVICLLSIKNQSQKNLIIINNYNQFLKFYTNLLPLLPNLDIEDYTPYADWGEIRYFFNDKQYKILSGGELDCIHDSINAFYEIYKNYDQNINTLINRSPLSDLHCGLLLQNNFINSVRNEKEKIQIQPKHIENPPCWFFEEHLNNSFKENAFIEDNDFKETYSAKSKDFSSSDLVLSNFINKYLNSSYSFFYIKLNTHYQLVLPRRVLPVIIEKWASIIQSTASQINSSIPLYSDFAYNIGKYIQNRIPEEGHFFTRISNGKNIKSDIFPFSIKVQNKIIFFIIPSPFEDLNKQIKKIYSKIAIHKKTMNHKWLYYSEIEKAGLWIDSKSFPDVEFIIILPILSNKTLQFLPSPDLNIKLWSLSECLGMFDETNSIKELSDFLIFLNTTPLLANSLMDNYALFKDSLGIINSGSGAEPSIIMNINYSADYRNKYLEKFYLNFPKNFIIANPTAYKVVTNNQQQKRVCSKNKFKSILYVTKENPTFSFTSPLELIKDLSIGEISTTLENTLCDLVWEFHELIKQHNLFKTYSAIHTIITPLSAVKDNKELNHLSHLYPKEQGWYIDIDKNNVDENNIKKKYVFIVFDSKVIQEKKLSSKAKNFEVDFFQDFIKQLNKIYIDTNINSKIFTQSNLSRRKKPRYPLIEIQPIANFPQHIEEWKPKDNHFKISKKNIAKIISNLNLLGNNQILTFTKETINILSAALDDYIQKEISKFNFESSLQITLTRVGALIFNNDIFEQKIRATKTSETEYDLIKKFSENNKLFQEMLKNYQYLLESSILQSAKTDKPLTKNDFQVLIATINWYFNLLTYSDLIHYSIDPLAVSITIDTDCLMNIKYTKTHQYKIDQFNKNRSSEKISQIPDDEKIDITTEFEKFLPALNSAFLGDLNFKFSTLTGILYSLSFWKDTENNIKEYYKETKETLVQTLSEKLLNTSSEEIELTLQFLYLKKDNLLKIITKENSKRIPVWEKYQRHSRLETKPLFFDNKNIYWSPCLTKRSEKIWISSMERGKFPVNLESQKIKTIMLNYKKQKELELEKIGFELAKQKTQYIEQNLDLHKRNKKMDFPQNLGDYDILAYIKKTNTILSIECKHLLQVFTAKDIRDLKEELFGKNSTDSKRSYSEKLQNRANYCNDNYKKIFKLLQWPEPVKKPQVIPVMLSIHSYWWTESPPVTTNIQYIALNSFSSFIEKYNV